MQKAEILIHPNPVLRLKCVKTAGDPREADLRRSLVEVLGRARGAGLAAPQIGFPLRAFAVAGTVLGEGWQTSVFVDPVIVASSGAEIPGTEGCLSIPGMRFSVMRFPAVRLAWTTETGDRACEVFKGFAARCIQHEMDHLDGVLICDKGIEVQ